MKWPTSATMATRVSQSSSSSQAASSPGAEDGASAIALRSDHPKLRKCQQGSIGLALEATKSDIARATALQDLRRNMYSASGDIPREVQWRRWQQFHRSWFLDAVPVLPLTLEKVEAVASMFRKGRYRSYNNYINMAVYMHVMAGYPMSRGLERMVTKTRRAVERGMGPADQSLPLDIVAVASLDTSRAPVCNGGFVHPKEAIIMGSFFMTREIELSAADIDHVHWDLTGRKVVWLLPASKTDTAARGVRRSWGCVCVDSALGSPCPYCASLVIKAFHDDRSSPSGTPLFCTASVSRVSKGAAVETIRTIAKMTDQVVSQDGVWLLGGHTLRVTGAQYMAALGIVIVIITLMGRWGSSLVLRYVAEAPLVNVTEEYRD